MMRQFPVILIPPEVQRIAQSKPPAPEFNIEIPSVPFFRQPKPIHIQEALGLTIGLVTLVAIVTLVNKILGLGLLIVGMVVIILRIRYQFQTYKKRYKKHQDTLQHYLAKFEVYSHQEIKYQRELAIAHAPERIQAFRYQQYRDFFAKVLTIRDAIAIKDSTNPFGKDQSKDEQAIEGVIYYFGINLQQYVTGTLYQGVKLFIPSIDYDWSPALVYIDPALNLHIAIEISVPSDNAAIIMRDDLAERFLVDSGWIIIKFAQEQILQSSTECCKEFAKLLDRLSFDHNVLTKFADTPDLLSVKR